jgi:hypothetical protein
MLEGTAAGAVEVMTSCFGIHHEDACVDIWDTRASMAMGQGVYG